ncbi:dihydrofolate reductase family protein [Thermocoleostomius sinensis]|uniref:Dihydrofolate reductase family protein n=1 Tax=Thermocoleostomius sinensis A174 TaxID=2016057 RepID=A0A9E9C4B5_9CYAN|nr:dihydrofolate reductase family protein [Thermocoleostomius sinensis]WAL59866.1 dihydrofolate reductase family protein [Thermocoleostomius sinensis A174]
MAELTLTMFLTLDGVMQAPGGPSEDTTGDFPHGGWLVPHADEEMGKTMDDIFSKAEAFLLGRTTYDIFAAHWPRITDTDELVANQLSSLPKYVASRTQTTFDWYGSSLIQDVVGEVGELKQRYSGEIQAHGSCGLAQTLIQHDLIDEYRLLIFPVILGTGKRLFGSGTVPSMLKLVSSSNTSKGTIVSVYRRAGKLQTGSFALD